MAKFCKNETEKAKNVNMAWQANFRQYLLESGNRPIKAISEVRQEHFTKKSDIKKSQVVF